MIFNLNSFISLSHFSKILWPVGYGSVRRKTVTGIADVEEPSLESRIIKNV